LAGRWRRCLERHPRRPIPRSQEETHRGGPSPMSTKNGDSPTIDPAVAKPDPHDWIKDQGFATTKDVPVPTRLIDQVLGQDAAVAVARKAAEQKRHLLLIGDPGTGKSMLAKAMTEILPQERQSDVLTYHNSKNPNNPKIAIVPGGTGRPIVKKYEAKAKRLDLVWKIVDICIMTLLVLGAVYLGFFQWGTFQLTRSPQVMIFIIAVMVSVLYGYMSFNRKSKG